MPRNHGYPPEDPNPKWVLTLRKPTRRKVLVVACVASLWALLDQLALHPKLTVTIAAAAVLLVLFVDLDPWQPRSSESDPLRPPR